MGLGVDGSNVGGDHGFASAAASASAFTIKRGAARVAFGAAAMRTPANGLGAVTLEDMTEFCIFSSVVFI